MDKERDKSLYQDVLEPLRRVVNTPPKEKLSASAKMNFTDSNQSSKEGLSNLLSMGKRKSSMNIAEATPDKRQHTDSSTTIPPSPWMKIDLIAAKAQITKLEARVNRQHTIQKEMQILMEQHKRDERALSDMEDRLNTIRRREQELKDELCETIKEHKDSKAKWELEKNELQKLLESNVSNKDQISEMKKDMDEQLQALEGAQAEVEMLKKEVAKQTSRAEHCTSLRTQLVKQTFELQQANSKLNKLLEQYEKDSYKDWQQQANSLHCTSLRTQLVKQTFELQQANSKLNKLLEQYEKDSYKDWQQQAKTAQKRLSNMAELEKEVARLRANERSLRDSSCNKLLLEKQVHQLSSRVEALQPAQNELHEAKVKLASLAASLDEWRAVGRAHGLESARALQAALDNALTSQLPAAVGQSQAQSQVAIITEHCTSLRTQLVKQTFELQQANSKLNKLLEQYEKDSYKDWQQQAKTAQKRLSNMAELEKEVARLRANERSLRDSSCNKLLLEKQVHQLSSRVEALQPAQNELHEAKVKLASLAASLDEWRAVGRAHGLESARALQAALDNALTSQLPAAVGQSQAQSQVAIITEEVATLKYERDKAATKPTDLLSVRKTQETLIRLQKQRQQLDGYEKELTVPLSGGAGSVTLSAYLERALQKFRD